MTADTTGQGAMMPGLPPNRGPESTQKRKAPDGPDNARKVSRRVSRACDQCKLRKARCSGTNPCASCSRKHEPCTWNARYSRGARKTPPRADLPPSRITEARRTPVPDTPSLARQVPSRTSPEIGGAEIRGQYYDLHSGLSFIHRAWRRLSARDHDLVEESADDLSHQIDQSVVSAGDFPLESSASSAWSLPSRAAADDLVEFYFDHCVVTYQLLHRPSVERWKRNLWDDQDGTTLPKLSSNAQSAAVIMIFGIATFRQERVRCVKAGHPDHSLTASDAYFAWSRHLTDTEKGLPRLESAQARLLQVLYLLQTSRMNQAWYCLGNALQIILALGLHRKSNSAIQTRSLSDIKDSVLEQCRKKVFWVAYTLDRYVCVVLGRPTHFHDNDIDQELPARLDDHEIQPDGPMEQAVGDCQMEGLIAHARLARIIGNISSEVYSVRPISTDEKITAADRYAEDIEQWRLNLPPHLGAIKPSSLIPTFRRQAVALKLGHAHAIMHAHRQFLLANMSRQTNRAALKQNILHCLKAARDALIIVDTMTKDPTLVYSLWWTYYVIFCALTVVYIWEIRFRAQTLVSSTDIDPVALFKLAERCHAHLVQPTTNNPPSRAYGVILEELRAEARDYNDAWSTPGTQITPSGLDAQLAPDVGLESAISISDAHEEYPSASSFFDDWQASSWLDFDSSAFVPFNNHHI